MTILKLGALGIGDGKSCLSSAPLTKSRTVIQLLVMSISHMQSEILKYVLSSPSWICMIPSLKQEMCMISLQWVRE